MKKLITAAIFCCMILSIPNLAAAQHIVKSGDTLWRIAQQNGMFYSRLRELNPQITDPNKIWIGQRINTDSGTPQDRIVEFALALSPKYVTRYVYGGNDFSRLPYKADCSAWTHYIYSEVLGVQLPRVSWEQARVGTIVNKMEWLQKGDLMFFGDNGKVSHVGIYMGIYNGHKSWISALGTGKDVQIFTLNGSWTKSRFLHGRRIIE